MKVRRYKDTDYPTICKWWDQWGFEYFPKNCLSKEGYIVENKRPIAAVWLYKTDSRIALLECFISDKNNKTDKALNYLINVVTNKALKRGLLILATTSNKGISNKLEKNNYSLIDNNMKHYLKNE